MLVMAVAGTVVVAGMMAVVTHMAIEDIEAEDNGITTLTITVMADGAMAVGTAPIPTMVPAGLPAAHSSSAFLSTPAQMQQLQTLTPG